MRNAETSAAQFIDEAQEMTPSGRIDKIKFLTDTFARCVQQAEDKVSLAVQTYDMVATSFSFGYTKQNVLKGVQSGRSTDQKAR